MNTPNQCIPDEHIIPQIGRSLDIGCQLRDDHVTHVMQDSYRMTEGGVLINCTSRDMAGRADKALGEEAHRDHVQPIPQDWEAADCEEFPATIYYNQQFAAAEITNLHIEECLFHSPDTNMQGIFMGDGFVRYPVIMNNEINTGSEHKISICALDGSIGGNVDSTGRPVRVVLTGLKIAGGLPGKPRIKIMSFDGDDEYMPADMIIHEEPEYWSDERTAFDDNTIHLEGFDLQAFRAAARQVTSHDRTGKPVGANAMCADFWELAQLYGTPVVRYY